MRRGKAVRNTGNKIRVVAAAVFAVLITAGLAGSAAGSDAFARLKENLDITKKGSITLTVADPGSDKGISGLSLELIQVASVIKNEDGNYVYVYTDDFKNSTTDLSKLSEADMGARDAAALMQTYVTGNSISGIRQVTDENGAVKYDNLELGVYLIQNNPVTENRESLAPFLVTVPRLLNDEYVYDVNATGKPLAPDIGGSGDPDDPDKNKETNKNTQGGSGSSTPGSSSSGGGSRLPQTGQLWWPVPVLTLVGLILIAAGIIRRRRGRKN